MVSVKVKGFLSLISAVLMHLLIGNLFSFPNLIPYYQSYLYYKNDNKEDISLMQIYFIAPAGIFVHNTFPSVMGIIDKKFGIRVLTIFATLCIIASQLIIYFFIQYYLLMIAFILYGFAASSTYFQTLRNCWKYFPNKKDLMSGIVFSSFGLSSFIFTTIADAIINPDNIKKEGKYYSKEIAYRFLDYLKIFLICIVVLGPISCALSFPYEEKKSVILDVSLSESNNESKNENDNNSESYKNYDENNNINDSDNDNKNINDESNHEDKSEDKLSIDEPVPLKKVILSLEFVKCLSIAGCTLIFGFLLANTYRDFGVEKELDENGMHTLSKVYTLLNTFSRLLWGVICDKFKFKIPYLIIVINQIVCGALIYFSASNIYTYYIVVCFAVLSYAGHIILFPNLIYTKFGVENSVILLGICGIFAGIAVLVGPVLTTFVNSLEDYLITYLVGVCPSIVSLILTIFMKTEPFGKKKLITDEISENKIIGTRTEDRLI